MGHLYKCKFPNLGETWHDALELNIFGWDGEKIGVSMTMIYLGAQSRACGKTVKGVE